ncbi:MAG: site-specific DNA-methyltransferase, partial [Bacteroidales bacterium]|nr:site-specific DNA-methyltransferase [Bacteroidales bacterium]
MQDKDHLNVDSLWIIGERDKSGKHTNVYHGNFIPQIPNQLINRYTKEGETVLDLFMGSGTTLFECEKLNRNFIGFDINTEIIEYTRSQMMDVENIKYQINECDVINKSKFSNIIKKSLSNIGIEQVQFIIAHPPYMDIVKFTDKAEDLSQIGDLSTFLKKMLKVMANALPYLEKNHYFGIVMGDVYKKSEVVPAAFYL